jgi:ribonuclease P protein component
MAAADDGAAPSPAPDAGDTRVETLKRRADFLAAARARRWAAQSFTLQGRARAPEEAGRAPPDLVRVGYTCSKKVGNAVARNRAKRRLRAAAAALAPALGRAGWDYVLVGKPGATAERPFAAMLDDLRMAFARVHGGRGK